MNPDPTGPSCSLRARPGRASHNPRCPLFMYAAVCPTTGQIKFGSSLNPRRRVCGINPRTGGTPKLIAQCSIGSRFIELFAHASLDESRVSGEWYRDDLMTQAMVAEIASGGWNLYPGSSVLPAELIYGRRAVA